MIPVCEPVLDGNERAYVEDCLATNWISSSGKYIPAFEEKFAEHCGAAHGVSCSSGTAALHLALAALGIGPGDEVIIPDFTLIVSANTVILCGARPVFVDVDPATWCIDATRIEDKITPATKAIMVVHMYGHPCDMGPILEIARRHRLKVIEDGAEAHGAEYNGNRVGGIGDVGCFSFYGNKIITTGEGGMVVTNGREVAEKVRLLRNQAFEDPRFVHKTMGFNYRFPNILAAIGLAQMERIDQKLDRKRALARAYEERLADADLTLPVEKPWARNVYWMYGIVLGDSYGERDAVMGRLRENGVDTRAFFYPMHAQPLFAGMDGGDPRRPDVLGDYPVSDMLWRRGLYLPSGMGLTAQQVDEVTAKLKACRQ